MRLICADVSLTHPSFKRLALELSEKGAAKLGITNQAGFQSAAPAKGK
jgi:hypothetical protein